MDHSGIHVGDLLLVRMNRLLKFYLFLCSTVLEGLETFQESFLVVFMTPLHSLQRFFHGAQRHLQLQQLLLARLLLLLLSAQLLSLRCSLPLQLLDARTVLSLHGVNLLLFFLKLFRLLVKKASFLLNFSLKLTDLCFQLCLQTINS